MQGNYGTIPNVAVVSQPGGSHPVVLLLVMAFFVFVVTTYTQTGYTVLSQVWIPAAPCEWRGSRSGSACTCFGGDTIGPNFTGVGTQQAFNGTDCDTPTCADSSDMAQCADASVPRVFAALIKNYPQLCLAVTNATYSCRHIVMALRDVINVMSFAYFPLRGTTITYKRIQPPTRFSPVAVSNVTVQQTSDPVEVLLYYADQIFTVIGEVEDLYSYKNDTLRAVVGDADLALRFEFWSLIHRPLVERGPVTWEHYLRNAGPQPWTVAANSSVYLGPRLAKSQFWGDETPSPQHSCSQNVAALVHAQVNHTRQLWKALRGIAPQWWEAVLDHSHHYRNMMTYHKLRKACRSLETTFVYQPQVLSAFYVPVSRGTNAWLQSVAHLPPVRTFGEAWCYGGFAGDNCTQANALGALLLIDDQRRFPIQEFWQLNAHDYAALRALVILKSFNLGTASHDPGLGSPLRPTSTGCPSELKGYKANEPFEFVRPSIERDVMSGTMCNLAGMLGDVHDKMVSYLNHPHNKALRRYVIHSCRQINAYLTHIDFDRVLRALDAGLCFRGA